MPDHLRLNRPTPVQGKRRPPNAGAGDDFDRSQQASSIRKILDGLEAGGLSFGTGTPTTGDFEDGETEMGTVVLKFDTAGQADRGPLSKLHMMALGENADNEYFVLSPRNSRQEFAELIAEYDQFAQTGQWSHPKSWAKALDKIRGVSVYGSADRYDRSLDDLSFERPQSLDVVLWPTSLLTRAAAKRESTARLGKLKELVAAAAEDDDRIVVLDEDPRPDTLLIRLVATRPLLEQLLHHPYVERVRGPLRPVFSPSDLLADGPRLDPPLPAGAAIGIVDDIVATANPWMSNVLAGSAAFPAGHVFASATQHGTQVASIAAYGSLDGAAKGQLVAAPFPIFSARVSENRAGQPAIVGNVVAQVEAAFEWLSAQEVRIVVIAFAYDSADTGPLPTELTVTVDRLAREFQMVVVASAGNVRELPDKLHWRDSYPHYLKDESARIAAPGTAALAITVGAIAERNQAHDETLTGIAPPGHPSPFTRIGPTRGNRDGKTQKPELVAPGGNFGWKSGLTVPVTRDPSLGVITLTGRNTPMFASTTGTSFAAPYVAHEVAKLATRYPSAGPNLLRALTALSAPPLVEARVPNLSPAIQFAYGVPRAERVLESGDNRAIFVFEGEIDNGTRVIHEIPIPREFAQVLPGAQGRVRIVLAFDPPVKRSRRNYVAGRMRFDFVKNMTLAEVRRTWSQQPTEKERNDDPGLPYDRMPGASYRPATIPKVKSVSSNTLIRRDIETTAWNEDDENYFLVVSHDSSPWTSAQLAENPKQNYALAIEIVDEGRPELDLFGLARARLEARTRQRAAR